MIYREENCPEILARFQSLSTKGTSRWLTLPPTNINYVINSSQYRTAVAHRCGIPSATLHKAGVFQCVCGKDAAADHRHFHTCNKLTGGGRTAAHNHMLFTLAQRLQELHVYIQKEPLYKDLIDSTREDHKLNVEYSQLRGDLAVVCDKGAYLVDVAVVQPDADSYIAKGADKESYVAIKHMEKIKTDKYEKFCHHAKMKMVPFVYDSYGCIGTQALKFLQTMSNLSESPTEWLAHTLNCLSACLQRTNALLVNRAISNCVCNNLQQHIAPVALNNVSRSRSPVYVDYAGYSGQFANYNAVRMLTANA